MANLRNTKVRMKKWLRLVMLLTIFFGFLLIFLLPVYAPTLASVSNLVIKPDRSYISMDKLKMYLRVCNVYDDVVWNKPASVVATCIKHQNKLIDSVEFAFWNGKLQVLIHEPLMVLVVKTNDTVYYVSSQGKAFRIDLFDNVPSNLPIYYIPKSGTLSKAEIDGLSLLNASLSCKQLFSQKGFPSFVFIVGQYARLTYKNDSDDKIIIVPLYDLSACERIDRYWDKIWKVKGRYVDFSHRRIIVVKDVP